MEMIRRVKSEEHADKWYLITKQFPKGIDYGPIFSKRTIKKWEDNGEVIGHRIRDNFEEWFIL